MSRQSITRKIHDNNIKNSRFDVAASMLWGISGCSDTKSPQRITLPRRKKTAKSADTPQREVWDVCFVQGARAGYVQTAYYQDAEAEKPVLRIEGLTYISVKRFGQDIQQQIHCTSFETPGGQLIRFETEMQMGTPFPTGLVVGKRLEMETVSQGKKMPGVIDWSPEYGGFYAVEQSLLQKPMQPGEKRTLQTLMAGFNQLATVEMARPRLGADAAASRHLQTAPHRYFGDLSQRTKTGTNHMDRSHGRRVKNPQSGNVDGNFPHHQGRSAGKIRRGEFGHRT